MRGVEFKALELLERQLYIQLEKSSYKGMINKVLKYSIKLISKAI